MNDPHIAITSSYACAIADGDQVVLTGGYGNIRDVSVYSMSGYRDTETAIFRDLNMGRQYHACSGFYNDQNQKVTRFQTDVAVSFILIVFRYIWWREDIIPRVIPIQRRFSRKEIRLGHLLELYQMQGMGLEQPLSITSSMFWVRKGGV